MNISEIADVITKFFGEVIKQKCRILSIMPKENKWEVLCEVTVDPDYTTRRGLGDIVEIYEVLVDTSMEINGFTLKETKRKVALDED
ncbi:MAG: hypothetical protein WCD89_21780 [Anaerocolumna sp.]